MDSVGVMKTGVLPGWFTIPAGSERTRVPDRSNRRLSSLPDEQLVAMCARGDRQAMDELVSRYHARLLDFAYRHLHDREAAADIAQSTLIRVFEAAGTYSVRASFRTWLYTIALNLIRDMCRRRNVRKESPITEHELDMPSSIHMEHHPSVENAAMEQMVVSTIWDAVEDLPDGQRSALILRFRQGLTYEEIADVMDAPSGTVKSWIHHGLKSLRQTLEPLNCE